jgi:hypothetical protein
MHQTTVRFGCELWEQLENEAERSGVSVAHYVRDAALARLAYTAGARAHSGAANPFAWAEEDGLMALGRRMEAQAEDMIALRAEAQQARRQSKAVRRHAATVRQQNH